MFFFSIASSSIFPPPWTTTGLIPTWFRRLISLTRDFFIDSSSSTFPLHLMTTIFPLYFWMYGRASIKIAVLLCKEGWCANPWGSSCAMVGHVFSVGIYRCVGGFLCNVRLCIRQILCTPEWDLVHFQVVYSAL